MIDKEGQIDMCKAIDDMIEDGRIEGEGKKLISQIQKKMAKNMNAKEIADIFEEELSVVEKICNIIQEHPEYTVDEIWRTYQRME